MKFREVDQANWDDFVQLFEGKGCPSYCWCMAWRPLPGDRQKASNADRKQALQQIVKAGTPVGILAYDGETPLGGETYEGVAEEKVWSLVCFFVPRARRGQGIGKQLLAAAIKTARKRGAKVVEAYPVDPDSPSYRFMGFVENFEKAGFTETGRAGKRRHVMHLRLDGK